MTTRGAHTLAEIQSQPDVWAAVIDVINAQAADLRAFWQDNSFDNVIFTGCGSTYYLSWFGAALFQDLVGQPARAYPGSELVFYPEARFGMGENTLVIAVSRSGETTETIEALKRFRKDYSGKVLVITCDSGSTLAQDADLLVAIDMAHEKSVAQTRSFASMAIVVQAVAGLFAGEDVDFAALPGIVARLFADYTALAQQLGEDPQIERFFFLGSDLLYGLAAEAMLKMKEMSLSYSEAYHMLEFRHGPMSMVNDKTLVVGLLSEKARQHEVAVLRDMSQQGAQVLTIAETAGEDLAFSEVIALQTGLPAWARAITVLPVLQLMAYYRAIFNEQDPDAPANLSQVIVLDPIT